jgi:predicted DNA-binding transcriptional regulator YafY
MFTREEVVALVAGARFVRAWGGVSMARAAEEALVKIEAVLPEETRARARSVPVHASSWDIPDDLRVRIDEIEAAVEARRRLVMVYRDAGGGETERVVRPLGLWFWGKVWTLVGWCELREDFRMFRPDRIDRFTVGERFPVERNKSLADFYRRMEAQDCDVGARPRL